MPPPTPKVCIAQLDSANGPVIILSGKAIMAVFTAHNHFTDASSFDFATWHVGSYFPAQESNLHPLHWKRGVLTTEPPGKSLLTLALTQFHPPLGFQ